jgi:hypothetical protein
MTRVVGWQGPHGFAAGTGGSAQQSSNHHTRRFAMAPRCFSRRAALAAAIGIAFAVPGIARAQNDDLAGIPNINRLTEQERATYRRRLQDATSEQERAQIREQARVQAQQRVQQQAGGSGQGTGGQGSGQRSGGGQGGGSGRGGGNPAKLRQPGGGRGG